MDMELFCKKLPKIELHAHLNGSLSKLTFLKLGADPDLISEYEVEEHTDLEYVFNNFKIAHELTSTKKNLYQATLDVIKDFSKDNVIYLELRTTPRKGTDMTEDEYIETVVEAIKVSEKKRSIIIKLLLSLNRSHTYEEQSICLDRIIKYKNLYPKIIRGVDLSGDPTKGSFYRDLFEKARENGLRTAIHCAEIKNDAETEQILSFKPDRLGHGTFLYSDYGQKKNLWEMYCHENYKIPVEICLTSNVVSLTATSYSDHHIKHWFQHNLPFCLSTDDKGVFQTSLSQEFLHLHKTYDLPSDQLWHISWNSVKYSFALDEEKEKLCSLLKLWISSENNNGV